MDNESKIPQTTQTGYDAADVVYRGDWDANGEARVGFPVEIAERLLEARGWVRSSTNAYCWVCPAIAQRTYGTYLHSLGEALQLALAAEVA